MVVVNQLLKKSDVVEVIGPSSYSQTTGIVVRFNGLRRIDSVTITQRNPLRINDLVINVDVNSISGNSVVLKAYQIDVTATAPATWTEVTNGTNLSALRLTLQAIGD